MLKICHVIRRSAVICGFIYIRQLFSLKKHFNFILFQVLLVLRLLVDLSKSFAESISSRMAARSSAHPRGLPFQHLRLNNNQSSYLHNFSRETIISFIKKGYGSTTIDNNKRNRTFQQIPNDFLKVLFQFNSPIKYPHLENNIVLSLNNTKC